MKKQKKIIVILLLAFVALLLYLTYPKLKVATRKDRLQYCNSNFKDNEACQRAGCTWGSLAGGTQLGQVVGCK